MTNRGGLYIRNVTFGIIDSLVSTVGLLSGLGASGSSREVILLTGIVYAFVEAFSMAVGSFVSEESVQELEARGEVVSQQPFIGGTVMFVSFILASFIPIVPYLIFDSGAALGVSIAASILALLIVGLINAKIVKVNLFKHSLKMALLGGAAIIIGVVVGRLVG